MQGNGAGARKCLLFGLRNIISTVLSLLIVSLLRLDQSSRWPIIIIIIIKKVKIIVTLSIKNTAGALDFCQILWQRQQMISRLQVKCRLRI